MGDSLASWPLRRHRALVIVLLLAMAIRLGWGLTRSSTEQAIDALPDQREYLALAQNLLHGQGFEFLDKRFNERVFAFRTPGYPVFLAACGANVRVARGVQALIDTSTVLAIYLLAIWVGRPQSGRSVGLVAAWIVALNPYLVYFSGLLLSETLFTAMLVWSMVLLVRGRVGQSGSWREAFTGIVGVFLLAISILVRPSAVALPVVLGLTAAVANYHRARAYRKIEAQDLSRSARGRWPLPVGLTTLLITGAVLIPWSLRNFHMLGRWVWLDTNSGFTLYDGYNPDATGGSDQSWIDREPELQVLSEAGRSEYLSQKAAEYIRGHREWCVELAAAKLARMWSPLPLSSEYGRTGYRLIALAYTVPLYILVVLGVLWGDLSRGVKFFLLTPAIYFSIVHALTIGSLRYRIPAEPPMAVVAACFIAGATRTGQSFRRP